jgi:hypothetical protein
VIGERFLVVGIVAANTPYPTSFLVGVPVRGGLMKNLSVAIAMFDGFADGCVLCEFPKDKVPQDG